LQPRIEQFSSWLSVVVAKQIVEPPKIHKNMKKDFISVRPSGSEKKNEPKVIGKVLNEYLRSNEPLAVAYRDRLFKDFFPDTHLDVDLKLMTREPGRMHVGAYLDGAITHDDEDHFTFIQNDPEKKKVVVTQRNPHVYLGKRINVNRKDDGTLYPTFNRPRYTKDFAFQDFCREAAEELLAVAGLVEEG
jgi:hypothetical protein